jgi:DNA repair protein RAD50
VVVTVKKGTRSQSTKDSTLVRKINGERITIPCKVAEIDSQIVDALGVSQAVLENVIFCHQDDSLWPLSEPSALKKKFDDIFEASQYTKAIAQLKAIQKSQGQMLVKYKHDEQTFQTDKEKGERNEKKRKSLEKDIAANSAEWENLTTDDKALEEKVKQKHEQLRSFVTIIESLKSKKDEFHFKNEAAKDLKSRIEPLTQSDEELERTLAEHQQRLERISEERDQKTREYQQLQSDLKSNRQEYNAKAGEKGKHESDKEKHERQIASREVMIQEAAAQHEIHGFDGELDDRQIQTFNDRIKKILADRRQDLERLQQKNHQELDKTSAHITELEGQRASQFQNRSSARTRITAIDKQIAKLQNDLNSLDVDEGAQSIHQSQMDDLNAQLEQAKASERDLGLDKQIKQQSESLRQLEGESEALSRELVDCTNLLADRAQLDLRKKELGDKKRTLESVITTWTDKLAAFLGAHWRLDAIEADYQTVLKQHAALVADAERSRAQAQQESKQLDFKLASAKDRLKTMLAEQASCKAAVVDALMKSKNTETANITQYHQELEELEDELRQTDTDIQLYDELKKFYGKAEKSANRSNKCYLCERDFRGDDSAKSKLMEKVVKKLSDEDKEELKRDKAEFEEKLKELQAVRLQNDTFQRLEEEIPPLEEEIKRMNAQKDDIDRTLDDKDQEFKIADDKRQDVESLRKTVDRIANLSRDVDDSEKKIETIASQQASASSTRSVDEINELQSNCSEQMRAVKIKLEKLRSESQRLISSISSLELQQRDLKIKISNHEQQLAQKKSLQEQLQQRRKDVSDERDGIQEADSRLEALEPLIQEAKLNRDEQTREARAKEQQAVDARDTIASTISKIAVVDLDIQDYLDRGGPAKLASIERALESLERGIAKMDQALSDLTREINGLKDQEDKGDRLKQNVNDNLQFRKLVRTLDDLQGDIRNLEARNAHEDYDRLSREANSLDMQRAKIASQRAKISGIIGAKEQEKTQLEEEFAQDYADAKRKFREAHIKVSTTKMAIEDLKNYEVALDKAIIQFHTLKMEEINRTVAELWQRTYQGTDIDTILIRSDPAEGEKKSNKSYNYRVCMVKGDTEMDMRGRCSAGQRVLACIIIRLALAESFGVNCGLIALDEPTTNLDGDNIRALASSLHSIIEGRRAQSNLQLIVITHDEEFLKAMSCSEFCDDFWRVRRDANQNSVLTRENITQLMDG